MINPLGKLRAIGRRADEPSSLTHDATGGSAINSSSSIGGTATREGSGNRPVRFAHIQKIAVIEVIAPAHAPITRGLYEIVAAPVAIIESIIVDHVSDSSVANTRPRNRSST